MLPEVPDLFLWQWAKTESLFIIGFIIIALVIGALQWLQKTIPMSFNIFSTQVIAILDAEALQKGLLRN